MIQRHIPKDNTAHDDGALPCAYTDETDEYMTKALEEMQRNPPPKPVYHELNTGSSKRRGRGRKKSGYRV